MDMNEFSSHVERIFDDQTTVFKLINLSFGFVLFDNATEQMQYHHSSANNNRVFDSRFQIRNRQNLDQIRAALENMDVYKRARQQRARQQRARQQRARQQRPSSNWLVIDITNATFYVTKLRDHPISRSVHLPKYVLENRAIVSLDCSEKNGLPYKDKLCFFRCLTSHRGCHPHNLERGQAFLQAIF